MPTISASDSRKSIMEDATVKIAINHLPHIRAEKTVLFCKPLVIDLLKRFEIILYTLIILRFLRVAGLVGRRNVGHALLPLFIEFLPCFCKNYLPLSIKK